MLINRPRQSRKSTMLLDTAYITGYPIVVSTNAYKMELERMAKELGFYSVDIYTIKEWQVVPHDRSCEKVLIDEGIDIINAALTAYLRATPVALTMTLPFDESKTEKENKDDSNI